METKEFETVITDFIRDIQNTFPEYIPIIKKWWKEPCHFDNIEDEIERQTQINKSHQKSIKFLFKFCQKKYPPRFFEIVYQNDKMFKNDDIDEEEENEANDVEYDTEFLPYIHFKNLWNTDISDNTRQTIWKYLQLILFTIVGSLENKEAFGDCAKLFEAIDENVFKEKMEETFSGIKTMFEDMSNNIFEQGIGIDASQSSLPNMEEFQEHLTGILDGKIGKLATEIAEEIAKDIDIDMENPSSMKDVFGKLMQNPNKIMNLVKNIGSKLEDKIKSGEIKESELMQEASEMLQKMKGMKGMGDIGNILSKMGMDVGKMNLGAMNSQLNKNVKIAKTKERMREKVEQNKIIKDQQQQIDDLMKKIQNPNQNSNVNVNNKMTDDELVSYFNTNQTNQKKKNKNKK
jgi:hypothetical protein